MAALLPIRGRVLEVRRYINPSIYWRRPPGSPEQYELWVRQLDGREFKITIHTQTMPARRGHMVSVITRANVELELELELTRFCGHFESPRIFRRHPGLSQAAIGI